MFEDDDLDTMIYRPESEFSWVLSGFILFYFGFYFLAIYYLFFGCLLFLEEEEDVDSTALDAVQSLITYIDTEDFSFLRYRKDEREGWGELLEDLLALLDTEIEDEPVYISNKKKLIKFYFMHHAHDMLKFRKHRLRRRLLIWNPNSVIKEYEKVSKIRNLARHRIIDHILYNKETKRQLSKRWTTLSSYKRQVLRWMRHKDVVNIYLFQTIIYSGIYPNGKYDYELFMNGDDDENRPFNNFLLIGNVNPIFYKFKNKIIYNSKLVEANVFDKFLDIRVIKQNKKT